MPDLFFADLVRETSSATGTGALALGGATPGHRRFVDAVPEGARFQYAIAGVTHENQWEIGEGELAGGGLVRHAVHASSTGALVNFAAGLKTVTLVVAAQWFAQREDRSDHGHQIDQVAGLAVALAAKQPAGSYAPLDHGHDYLPRDPSGSWVTGNANLGVGSMAPYARLEVRGASMAGYSLQSAGPVNGQSGMQLYLGDANFYHPDFWNSAPGIGSVADPTGVGGAIGLCAYGGQPGGNALVAVASFSGYSARGFTPGIDNMVVLGRPELRWMNIYAASGTISTSDARDKRWLGGMSAPKSRAACDIITELGFFQWEASIEGKGADEARRHFGVRAQTAFAIMERHGLDWRRYGWCCHDRWEDEDGEHERFGIRSDQLCLFLIAALAQRTGACDSGAADAAG